MPSTYTANNGIELIANGEKSGTWGDVTNTNLQIVDRLVSGVGAISLSGTTHTLSTTDGTLSNGQYRVLVFGGTPSGTNTVTIDPNDQQKLYFVKNSSGQSVVLTQGSGGNVTVANGDTKIVYADGAGSGAAVVDLTADFAMSSVNITGGAITGITDLAVADGGTGSSTASGARSNLGLGTIATQAANSVTITGGSITGITDLAVADGGTGVSTSPTSGQLLIGNNSGGYTVNTISAGNNITVSNTSGAIQIGCSVLAATSSVSTISSFGYQAGAGTGSNNVFIGYQSAKTNTTGLDNTSVGFQSLYTNSTGFSNVAVGSQSLYLNTASNNTAVGFWALTSNTSGAYNVAVGTSSLESNETGGGNTAVGYQAGLGNTTGTYSTYVGHSAGFSSETGANNTVIGYNAQPSTTSVSNQITLGNSSISTLRCQVTTITSLSDARDKRDIQTMEEVLPFVEALRPVQFEWNTRDGGKVGERDTGFLAQELVEAQSASGFFLPGLVYDDNPDHLEAGYGKLLPVLVKAVQELTAKVKALETLVGSR